MNERWMENNVKQKSRVELVEVGKNWKSFYWPSKCQVIPDKGKYSLSLYFSIMIGWFGWIISVGFERTGCQWYTHCSQRLTPDVLGLILILTVKPMSNTNNCITIYMIFYVHNVWFHNITHAIHTFILLFTMVSHE